jgi:hypothetical protein
VTLCVYRGNSKAPKTPSGQKLILQSLGSTTMERRSGGGFAESLTDLFPCVGTCTKETHDSFLVRQLRVSALQLLVPLEAFELFRRTCILEQFGRTLGDVRCLPQHDRT